MKNILTYSFLVLLTLLTACRKSDNPRIPTLARVPVPKVTKDPAASLAISSNDLGAFKGKVVVDMFFKNDVPPQKVDVVVIKNSAKANVKVLQANVTTFPTTVEVTADQLIALFGGTIVLGDNFDIGVDITTADGQVYQAFPAVGAGYGAGVSAQYGGVSTSVRYSAVCAFNQSLYNGNYKVTQDDWADFGLGELIEVKPGTGANQISITAYPSPAYGTNRKPMIIDVNPATGEVTIPVQVIGDYDGAAPGATVRGTGSVDLCTGNTISLTVTLNIGGSDYAGNVFTIEK